MSEVYNIYCDESCHLENDNLRVMILGSVWCSVDKRREISMRLREIKEKHDLPAKFEVKWTKVSPAKVGFYLEFLDYFFDDDDLNFRALIVPDKSLLRHEEFGQDHETFYYKMYFAMLNVIIDPKARYHIYLDIKDTQGGTKKDKLHDVLCNNRYDFSREIIERVQLLHSHEVEQLQLADLLIGAVSYAARELTGNAAKEALVKRMQQRSGYCLTRSTLLREKKVNILRWHARGE